MDGEPSDAKLKLELLQVWKKRVTNAKRIAAGAGSETAEVKNELGKFDEKRNEF